MWIPLLAREMNVAAKHRHHLLCLHRLLHAVLYDVKTLLRNPEVIVEAPLVQQKLAYPHPTLAYVSHSCPMSESSVLLSNLFFALEGSQTCTDHIRVWPNPPACPICDLLAVFLFITHQLPRAPHTLCQSLCCAFAVVTKIVGD